MIRRIVASETPYRKDPYAVSLFLFHTPFFYEAFQHFLHGFQKSVRRPCSKFYKGRYPIKPFYPLAHADSSIGLSHSIVWLMPRFSASAETRKRSVSPIRRIVAIDPPSREEPYAVSCLLPLTPHSMWPQVPASKGLKAVRG